MSEPKLISPMLDNFVMGDPISSHHGICCCPAMPKNSDDKYIVKIISIPASQVQLDALLLTGAYPNEAAALSYFHDLSMEATKEVEILNKLAGREGFHPIEGCQIELKTNEIGYDVYLLSRYRRSLERHFRKHTMTQLNAVNLGLDMCASLAVSRRAGYMYVALKPSNIFVSEDQEYRIGDIGFIAMDSLQYSSLPEKYVSPYTAPELKDPFASLNATADIYTAGMILYQVYNDGKLPDDDRDESEPLPPPAYADYEMAEIILKACAPKPEDRWTDPIEMGQAIVDYMQRNGANDVPIVAAESQQDQAAPVFESEEPAAEADIEAPGAEDDDLDEVIQLIMPGLERIDPDEFDPAQEQEDEVPTKEEAAEAEDPANLSFLDELSNDETAPDEALADDIEYGELSDDTSDILAQADELLAHETPEGVIAPEPIEIPMPASIVTEPAPEADMEPVAEDPDPEFFDVLKKKAAEESEAEPVKSAVAVEEEDLSHYVSEKELKRKPRSVFGTTVAILLIAALLVGGYFFYTNYYLQTIDDLQVSGTEDQLFVSITSDIDESLLTVVCTDNYGNKKTSKVVDGKATFTDLNPNTLYNVKVEISGLHALKEEYKANYSTPEQTRIIEFSAVAGSEDGSVILRFTVDGKDAEVWKVIISAEGEEDRIETFTSHMVTINGLSVGKEYTIRLDSESPLYIVGNNTLQLTAQALVYAQELTITKCSDGELTAQWVAPEGQSVSSWTVRCYNDSGYDESFETAETTATFTGLDTSLAYTVEVTAAGMTTGSRDYVAANSVTVTGLTAAATDNPMELSVSWDYTGVEPEGNWLLLYTIDGSTEPEVIRTEEASAIISPMIPGATYSFTLQTESGITVFGSEHTATAPEAESFEGFTVSAKNMTFKMCVPPDEEDWNRDDVEEYTTSFAVGESAAFTVRLNKQYSSVVEKIVTMYVIHDANGVLVSKDTQEATWNKMWYKYNCELIVPQMPQAPGQYTMDIYFNGMYVHSQEFEITE